MHQEYKYEGGRSRGKTLDAKMHDMHVELYPVCKGSGKYIESYISYGQTTGVFDYYYERTCHGCNGKGWVVIPTYYGIR